MIFALPYCYSDLREERKDVGADIPRRLDTIYLYGTDDMSTADVFKYFDGYGPECVEWINDSSCTQLFQFNKMINIIFIL